MSGAEDRLVHYLASHEECAEARLASEEDGSGVLGLPFSWPSTIVARGDPTATALGTWHEADACGKPARGYLDPAEWPGGRIPEEVATSHGIPEDGRGAPPVLSRPRTFLEAFKRDLEVGLARHDRKLDPRKVAEAIRQAQDHGWAVLIAPSPTVGDLVPVGIFTAVRDQDAVQVAFGAMKDDDLNALLLEESSTPVAVAVRRASTDMATVPRKVALAWTDLILGPARGDGPAREVLDTAALAAAIAPPASGPFGTAPDPNAPPTFRVAAKQVDGGFEAENQDRFVTVGPWRVDLPVIVRHGATRDDACIAVAAELKRVVEESMKEQTGGDWSWDGP